MVLSAKVHKEVRVRVDIAGVASYNKGEKNPYCGSVRTQFCVTDLRGHVRN